MTWKEQSKLSKIAFIIGMVCFFAGITLTVLGMMNVLTPVVWLEDILGCTFWLSIGVAFVKKETFFAIICFALFGLNLYLSFL